MRGDVARSIEETEQEDPTLVDSATVLEAIDSSLTNRVNGSAEFRVVVRLEGVGNSFAGLCIHLTDQQVVNLRHALGLPPL